MVRGSRFMVASVVAGLTTLTSARASAQVAGGQVENFEGGGTGGWVVPDASHPAPPTNVPTGGPGGANDNYLLLRALGAGGAAPSGAGSRLSAINFGPWSGDYIAAGITGIGMDVANFGQTDVYLRLLFADFPAAPGPPSDIAWSAEAVVVRAGAGWTRVFFPILPGALIVPVGTYAGALGNAEELRLFHNPAPAFAGPPNSSPPIAATIGIDNVTAVVPEPSSFALLATGVVGLIAWHRRRTAR
ncbi:MAG: PEP-CTERM sorting domain-containing protein [Gemmatirosa sp.]